MAYLSACGKHSQLSMYGASWLEPPLLSLTALEPISYFNFSLAHCQMLHIAIVEALSVLLHINSTAKSPEELKH